MLKTIIVILAAISLSFESNSQITKGNLMLGGNINYSSTNFNSENFGVPHKYYSLQIKPNIGYFFVDKFAAGLKVGINKEGEKANNYTDFNVGPFIRYYFLHPEKKINILTEANYQYGFLGIPLSNNTSTSKNSFALSAGPVFYFNTSVGLEFLVSYSTYKFSGIKGSNNTIMFGLGLQVHLEKEK